MSGRHTTAALVALLIVGASGGAWAQKPSATPPPPTTPPATPPAAPHALRYSESFTPLELKVGEAATWLLRFEHQGTVSIRVPEGLSFGQLELLDRDHGFERDSAGNVAAEVFTFRVAGYRPGELRVPPIPFEYVDSGGSEHRVEVPGHTVRVRSMLENEQEQELRPAPGPLPLIVEDLTLLYVGGVLLALLVGAGLGFLLFRFVVSRRPPPPPPPPRPPEEVARKRLAALEVSPLLGQGKVKEFYLELTAILREYLGRRFGIDGPAMTSTEVLRTLFGDGGVPRKGPGGRRPSDDSVRRAWMTLRYLRQRELEAFFDEADIVEFARYEPGGQETTAIVAQARAIIDLTTLHLPGGLAAAEEEAPTAEPQAPPPDAPGPVTPVPPPDAPSAPAGGAESTPGREGGGDA